jgi:hypothetical protein
MSDDPINALVSELLAEADAPIESGTITLALDDGLTLVHNPCGRVMTDGDDGGDDESDKEPSWGASAWSA